MQKRKDSYLNNLIISNTLHEKKATKNKNSIVSIFKTANERQLENKTKIERFEELLQNLNNKSNNSRIDYFKQFISRNGAESYSSTFFFESEFISSQNKTISDSLNNLFDTSDNCLLSKHEMLIGLKIKNDAQSSISKSTFV